jgi:hypothetical protein
MFRWLLLALLLPVIASANVGSIVQQQGNSVQIRRGSDTLPGGVNAGVNMNDAIVTGLSSLQLRFQDNTTASVTENSRFVIDDFVYDPSRGAGRLNVRVAVGTVRYVSGQIARSNQQNVQVNTPTAVIGVRGTDFFMTVDESGQSLVVLVPSCNQQGNCYTGKISVTNDGGTVEMDQPFHATYVPSATVAPTVPVQLNISISDINNNLVIVKPPQIMLLMQESQSSQQSSETQQSENQLQIVQTETRRPIRRVGELIITEEGQRTIATRESTGHTAIVRMTGGNTRVTVTHDGAAATETVGTGSNIVNITQKR